MKKLSFWWMDKNLLQIQQSEKGFSSTCSVHNDSLSVERFSISQHGPAGTTYVKLSSTLFKCDSLLRAILSAGRFCDMFC